MLHDLFTPDGSLLEKLIRPLVVYVFLVVVLRVFGKRELAQLNPFDLVVLLSLSNAVQNAIIGQDTSISGGLITALVLLASNYLVVRFLFRHRRLDQLLEGHPTLLIEHGHVIYKALARELLTESELRAAAHRQGFAKLQDIERCILEPGGVFFFQGKTPMQAEIHHHEVLCKLKELGKQVEELRTQLAPKP